MLLEEVSIIAERWKWSKTEILELTTSERREYIKKIVEMYERESKKK